MFSHFREMIASNKPDKRINQNIYHVNLVCVQIE